MQQRTTRSGPGLRGTVAWLVVLATTPLLFAAVCAGGEEDNTPLLAPFSPELAEQLHAIRARMSDERGLAINEETEEGWVTNDQLRDFAGEFYEELDEDDERELEAFNVALRLLHLIGPDDDIREIDTNYHATGIAGVYFPRNNSLALVGDVTAAIGARDEMVLAHEYVHSFQYAAWDSDYWSELIDAEEEGSATEYGTTMSCLREGDASLSMVRYMEETYGDDWRAQLDDPADAEEPPGSEPDEETTPPGLQRYYNFDYRECTRFVSTLHALGGWEGVDAAYASPPSTTEQILHPEKYGTGEASRSAAPADLTPRLGDGWSRLDLAPFGEFDVYNYLATVLDDEPLAAAAAAGWGSGWMAVYVEEQEEAAAAPPVLLHIRLDFDTEFDYVEFAVVYGEAISIIARDNRQLDLTEGEVRWQGDGEFGAVVWNDELNRFDLYISTLEDTRGRVSVSR